MPPSNPPNNSSPPIFTGSCACKRVRYTSTSLPSQILNCHCTECRKASGGPYQSWSRNKVSDITWTENPPHSQQTSEYATRGFCSNCGSSMSMQYISEPDMIGIPAGTIDDESLKEGGEKKELPRPAHHIFLREKASWFEVPDDGLERWEGFTAEMEELYNLWTKKK
ncbi:hypothetical protein FQN54_009504 [Arachnomyces sp. PD_36]|nr:hypothetical protein FQN54_009504 [Arachnomyces sp. PD_36]